MKFNQLFLILFSVFLMAISVQPSQNKQKSKLENQNLQNPIPQNTNLQDQNLQNPIEDKQNLENQNLQNQKAVSSSSKKEHTVVNMLKSCFGNNECSDKMESSLKRYRFLILGSIMLLFVVYYIVKEKNFYIAFLYQLLAIFCFGMFWLELRYKKIVPSVGRK